MAEPDLSVNPAINYGSTTGGGVPAGVLDLTRGFDAFSNLAALTYQHNAQLQKDADAAMKDYQDAIKSDQFSLKDIDPIDRQPLFTATTDYFDKWRNNPSAYVMNKASAKDYIARQDEFQQQNETIAASQANYAAKQLLEKQAEQNPDQADEINAHIAEEDKKPILDRNYTPQIIQPPIDWSKIADDGMPTETAKGVQNTKGQMVNTTPLPDVFAAGAQQALQMTKDKGLQRAYASYAQNPQVIIPEIKTANQKIDQWNQLNPTSKIAPIPEDKVLTPDQVFTVNKMIKAKLGYDVNYEPQKLGLEWAKFGQEDQNNVKIIAENALAVKNLPPVTLTISQDPNHTTLIPSSVFEESGSHKFDNTEVQIPTGNGKYVTDQITGIVNINGQTYARTASMQMGQDNRPDYSKSIDFKKLVPLNDLKAQLIQPYVNTEYGSSPNTAQLNQASQYFYDKLSRGEQVPDVTVKATSSSSGKTTIQYNETKEVGGVKYGRKGNDWFVIQ